MRILVTEGGAIYQTTLKQNGKIDNNNRLNVTNETIHVVMEYMRMRCESNGTDNLTLLTEHGTFQFIQKGAE